MGAGVLPRVPWVASPLIFTAIVYAVVAQRRKR